MNGDSQWVANLLRERESEQREAQARRDQELLQQERVSDLAPQIWQDIEEPIKASVDCFNRSVMSEQRVNIKPSLGPYSILVYKDEYRALAISLNPKSGIVRYGNPGDPQRERALAITIDYQSHWSIQDPRTRTEIPIERIGEIMLRDFLKSLI
jgi:hypothetical protein